MLDSSGPADYLEPPLPEFEDTLRQVSDLILLLQRSEPGRAPTYRARRDDLEVQGRTAHEAGDFLTWPWVDEQLDDLHEELLQISSVREIVMIEQTPRVVRSWMVRRIDRTDAEIRRKHDELQLDARLEDQDRAGLPAQRDDLLAELAVVAMAIIDQVDVKRASAPEQMWIIWFDRLKPLTRRVANWGREARMRKSS